MSHRVTSCRAKFSPTRPCSDIVQPVHLFLDSHICNLMEVEVAGEVHARGPEPDTRSLSYQLIFSRGSSAVGCSLKPLNGTLT